MQNSRGSIRGKEEIERIRGKREEEIEKTIREEVKLSRSKICNSIPIINNNLSKFPL